ncbi:hypothetical protein [Paracoccus fistulariae]|uniref:Uncharacterized protein n=1 Tax=Paracoccus fistulariae TaxID=658446 RepID=A0ABY7SGW7_9RHOB|nr:hypothetical protein [Paracoccus fistulariae]MDB6181652.1 hypothetical protein [Paracoccus fistulariae]WCR06041.1 hypothetical protein JHX87_11020 [Paracoccus fistulariae]
MTTAGTLGEGAGRLFGGWIGGIIGSLIPPPVVGTMIGRSVGARLGGMAGRAAAATLQDHINSMEEAEEEAEETDEQEGEKDDSTICEGCGELTLPEDPEDLLEEGWEEEQHPAPNRRRFRNPETGEVLEFDKGESGRPGWAGRDHYHRTNPNRTGRGDHYLDKNGAPTPKNSGSSHISPGTTIRNPNGQGLIS